MYKTLWIVGLLVLLIACGQKQEKKISQQSPSASSLSKKSEEPLYGSPFTKQEEHMDSTYLPKEETRIAPLPGTDLEKTTKEQKLAIPRMMKDPNTGLFNLSPEEKQKNNTVIENSSLKEN